MKESIDFILRSNVDPQKMIGGAVEFPDNACVDYSKHGRDGHIMHVILSGEREYIFKGEKTHLEAHSVVFIPDGTKYISTCFATEGKTCKGLSVKFWLDGELERNISEGIYAYKSHPSSHLERDFFELAEIFENEPSSILKQKKFFFSVLTRFIEKYSNTNDLSRSVVPAIEYISLHFKENDPVAKYAAICNMSESYFRKIFQLTTGLSPISYRNSLRLTEAKKMYREGLTLKAIAVELGFCDEHYLSKIYKRENGTNIKEDAELV